MFERVLVANRGEIARRVIRTLDRLGIGAVAVFAPADRHSPHVREAATAVPISSYLAIEEILEACAQTESRALHPGYGFLSENPALARACVAAGVVFVGPPPQVIELMGDKLRAKKLAQQAGLPVVASFSEAEAAAPGAPYPLLVKAAAGGGGRGMRVVESPEGLAAGLESARREARAGFEDDRVFIERFLPRARHIEVQVLADAHGTVIHLGERECSLQRRHQKVIEECPSPAVDAGMRERLGDAAVSLATEGGYVGAGTVEFIVDADDPGEHYFLEMNARLQVEHPVTELVTGLDLVEQQLRIAAGERLGIEQHQVRLSGHAIEARINAEDAWRDFLPTAGRVLVYRRPLRARIDDAIETGTEIDTAYDSLLAKVIVHGADRATALAELERELARTTILGVSTTTGFLRLLIATEEMRAGRLDTGLIGRLAPLAGGPPNERVALAAALVSLALLGERAAGDPFGRVDGWRLGGRRAGSWWRLAVGAGDPLEVQVIADPSGDRIAEDHDPERTGPSTFAITLAGERNEWSYAVDHDVLWIGSQGWAEPVRQSSAEDAEQTQPDGAVRAPMPGEVLLVPASLGAEVRAGDPLVVLESMKMELVMTAPVDGRVSELTVVVGDRVVVDQPLAQVDAAS
jgi:acetyl-CoA/propionyl-CoA carboxylase, biotin carboxylase, biotin carboxyl carrier protein